MRLGVFGGTFDPIHNAHLFVAESARLLERLDRVLFVPTGNQHYRDKPQADAAASLRDDPGRDREQSPRSSSTTPTCAKTPAATPPILLPLLHAKYPDAGFTFIIGADSLASANWVRLDEVLESARAICRSRRVPGVRADALARVIAAVPPGLRERVSTLNLPEIPESASLVRTLIAQGRSIRYLVPEPVWQYIVAHAGCTDCGSDA